MKISDAGIEFIKKFEGCRLTAYKVLPSEKFYTIGYGHCASDVVKGMTINVDEAERLLRDDLCGAERMVNRYCSIYRFNQNEYDALVSFAFNVGGIVQLTADGTRSKSIIAAKMLEYCNSGGKVLPGLVRRRRLEQNLFMTPVRDDGWGEYMEGREAIAATLRVCASMLCNEDTVESEIEELSKTMCKCASLLDDLRMVIK